MVANKMTCAQVCLLHIPKFLQTCARWAQVLCISELWYQQGSRHVGCSDNLLPSSVGGTKYKFKGGTDLSAFGPKPPMASHQTPCNGDSHSGWAHTTSGVQQRCLRSSPHVSEVLYRNFSGLRERSKEFFREVSMFDVRHNRNCVSSQDNPH